MRTASAHRAGIRPVLNRILSAEQVGRALGDHDGRGVSVPADDLRHHRGVDHA